MFLLSLNVNVSFQTTNNMWQKVKLYFHEPGCLPAFKRDSTLATTEGTVQKPQVAAIHACFCQTPKLSSPVKSTPLCTHLNPYLESHACAFKRQYPLAEHTRLLITGSKTDIKTALGDCGMVRGREPETTPRRPAIQARHVSFVYGSRVTTINWWRHSMNSGRTQSADFCAWKTSKVSRTRRPK